MAETGKEYRRNQRKEDRAGNYHYSLTARLRTPGNRSARPAGRTSAERPAKNGAAVNNKERLNPSLVLVYGDAQEYMNDVTNIKQINTFQGIINPNRKGR